MLNPELLLHDSTNILKDWPGKLDIKHWHGSHYSVTHVRNKNSRSKEVTLCGESDFPYQKELLLKQRILSFKRSFHFEKGPN